MQHAFLASAFAGCALALLGPFVLARGISFSGLAASQIAALGTVVGSLLSLHYGEYGLALVFVAGGMLALSWFSKSARLPAESWVGTLYILGAAAAVLILSKAPQGESHTLGIFFGNVLSSGLEEVWEGLGILAFTVFMLAIFYHRWVWLAFDSQTLQVSGHKTGFWNFSFFLLFPLTMTIAIHIFGVLLAFAYLILPASAGLLLFNRMKSLFIFLPLYTVAVTLAGYYGSFVLDFPAGPFLAVLLTSIVLTAGAVRAFLKN